MYRCYASFQKFWKDVFLTSMLPDSSTTVLPLLTWIYILQSLSNGQEVDAIFLDLSKAFVDTHTRKLLYCCIVRPQLVYGSEVWSPYTIKLKMKIEHVQRRGTKFKLRYPKDTYYKQRLIRLSMLPLEYIRP